MRSPKLILLLILFLTFLPSTLYAVPTDDDDTESIIIEVEGEPEQYKAYMETYHPFIDVVAVYDTLFNGLALQGTPENLAKMEPLEFITNIHTVQQYEATPWGNFKKTETSLQQPFDFNDTAYTGKGVKVGVIDTGIDYEHPDLELNYRSGYDLVDLDDDPMETVPEQGIPTSHGSHVAGIIAANGDIKGVAPNAEIYAYRALGPGGAGTTVQVLAAMEKAIEDDVDVINLSLGNNVNVPDYPTSMAVNRASEMGIPVVIANGNSGPDNWTVGSPATANEALSVGASTSPTQVPFLYESLEDKAIQLQGMAGSPAWELTQSNEIVDATNTSTSLNGKIALIKRGKIPFYELVKTVEKQGAVAVVIYNNQEGPLQGSVANEKDPITIPVAAISKEEGEWLKQETAKKKLYMETKYWNQQTTVAPFSSRGPVTVNWNIKPDVVAPGTGILSTVPGGYEQMDGTSMAAPHVAGVVALIKEAHPDWTRDQIFGAIKTTANRMASENMPAPTIQGMGLIQPNEAIHTETIIHNAQLNFGKVNEYREEHSLEVTFENLSDETKEYTFDYPKKENGIYWEIPQSITLDAKEKKTITIGLDVTTAKLEKGVHQGWLTVKENNEEYQLPYLFVNQSTDQPKTAGFEFALKNFSKDAYEYKLYVTEAARKVEVDLYHPDSLQFNRQLLETDNLEPGLHEGELSKKEAGPSGYYLAIITVYLEDGTYESNQTMLYLE